MRAPGNLRNDGPEARDDFAWFSSLLIPQLRTNVAASPKTTCHARLHLPGPADRAHDDVGVEAGTCASRSTAGARARLEAHLRAPIAGGGGEFRGSSGSAGALFRQDHHALLGGGAPHTMKQRWTNIGHAFQAAALSEWENKREKHGVVAYAAGFSTSCRRHRSSAVATFVMVKASALYARVA